MNMLIKLTEYFKDNGFEDSTIKRIINNFSVLELNKGDCILKKGEQTTHVYFTLEGIIRSVRVMDNGSEYTMHFYNEGQWSGLYNFLKGYPARVYMEAIEDTKVACISNEDLKKIIINEPECNDFYMRLYTQISEEIRVMMDKFDEFTPEQKYNRFMNMYSDIKERIDKKYLYSYIGCDI